MSLTHRSASATDRHTLSRVVTDKLHPAKLGAAHRSAGVGTVLRAGHPPAPSPDMRARLPPGRLHVRSISRPERRRRPLAAPRSVVPWRSAAHAETVPTGADGTEGRDERGVGRFA